MLFFSLNFIYILNSCYILYNILSTWYNLCLMLMNFLPGRQSPITLLELGLFARSGKLHVVCPPDFYRYDNVRITCSRYGVPIYQTLEEAVSAILGSVQQASSRSQTSL